VGLNGGRGTSGLLRMGHEPPVGRPVRGSNIDERKKTILFSIPGGREAVGIGGRSTPAASFFVGLEAGGEEVC